jgi:hypothetical protein
LSLVNRNKALSPKQIPIVNHDNTKTSRDTTARENELRLDIRRFIDRILIPFTKDFINRSLDGYPGPKFAVVTETNFANIKNPLQNEFANEIVRPAIQDCYELGAKYVSSIVLNKAFYFTEADIKSIEKISVNYSALFWSSIHGLVLRQGKEDKRSGIQFPDVLFFLNDEKENIAKNLAEAIAWNALAAGTIRKAEQLNQELRAMDPSTGLYLQRQPIVLQRKKRGRGEKQKEPPIQGNVIMSNFFLENFEADNFGFLVQSGELTNTNMNMKNIPNERVKEFVDNLDADNTDYKNTYTWTIPLQNKIIQSAVGSIEDRLSSQYPGIFAVPAQPFASPFKLVFVWITMKDERVCFICQDLAKTFWELDEIGVPHPRSAHPRCRCRVMIASVPVTLQKPATETIRRTRQSVFERNALLNLDEE